MSTLWAPLRGHVGLRSAGAHPQGKPVERRDDSAFLALNLSGTGYLPASGGTLAITTTSLSLHEARCAAALSPQASVPIRLLIEWPSQMQFGKTRLRVSGQVDIERRRLNGFRVRSDHPPELIHFEDSNGDPSSPIGQNLGTPPLLQPLEIKQSAFEYYERLRKVRNHVMANPGEAVSLKDAAKVAGMESTYFSAFFSRKVGVPFRDWMQSIRLNNSLALLTTGNRTITYVAMETGFTSLRSFERAFRKHCGLRPTDFKKMIRPC